jgi:hypothetical protein
VQPQCFLTSVLGQDDQLGWGMGGGVERKRSFAAARKTLAESIVVVSGEAVDVARPVIPVSHVPTVNHREETFQLKNIIDVLSINIVVGRFVRRCSAVSR